MFEYKEISDEMFEDIKQTSIKIWNTYDNQFGYVTEKVERVNNITNIKDNYYFIIAMFDIFNQRKLLSFVKEDTRQFLHQEGIII